MKKILFATDFSQQSENAFPLLLEMAEKFASEIILLHVYRVPHTYKFPYTAQTFEDDQREVEAAKQKIEEIFNTHFEVDSARSKISYKVVRDSSAERGILKVAEDENVDLISLAVRGDNQSEEKLFGSLIKNLVRHAIPPVLVIPEGAKSIGLERFLFTTNLSPAEILPLNGLIQLVKPFKPRITVLHINSTNDISHEVKLKDFKEAVSKYINYDNLYFHETTSNNVFASLEDRVKNFKYDILAMTKQWHSSMYYRMFHRDLVEKMEFSSTIPVLTFNLSMLDNFFFRDEISTDELEDAEKVTLQPGRNTQEVLTEINTLTVQIETNYPELYQHLDNDPISIASDAPGEDIVELNDYLISLQQLIDHHREQREGGDAKK